MLKNGLLYVAIGALSLILVKVVILGDLVSPEVRGYRKIASMNASVCQQKLDNNKFKVVSYNVFLRPTFIFDDNQINRAKQIPKYLSGNDVLFLVEAFDDVARDILLEGLDSRFPYRTKILGSDGLLNEDGGVIIVSCWPIVEEDELLFGGICANTLADCLAKKGVKYAKINKNQTPIHLFATHLEAGYLIENRNTRKEQLLLLADFIKSKNIPKTETILIGGDFNIHYEDLNEFKDEKAMKMLSRAPAQLSEYLILQKLLNVNLPKIEGHRFTCDPKFNALADRSFESEYIDYIFYSNQHKVPKNSDIETMILKERGLASFEEDLSDHFAVRATFEF